MSTNNYSISASHEDDDPDSVESLEASWSASSSSEFEAAQESADANSVKGEDIDVGNRKGADILLHIHDQLDLDRLQKMKDMFFVDNRSGSQHELDVKEFSDALRLALPDMNDVPDEELEVLFMKIDANNNGGVDWDEFTGFLLQLDEGSRNMDKAIHMVDLRPLPSQSPEQRYGSKGSYHRDMIEKVVNVERAGTSAYVTCGRDGTIKFWHKETFMPLRSINHLDTIKAACSCLVLMPLSNRIVAACLDRTLSFYEMITGEFACRIAGLRSSPTCVGCIQLGANEQQVIFGDSDGHLHVWTFEDDFYVPGPHDTREATGLRGNFSNQIHEGAVCGVSYVDDLDAVVTCGVDGKVHLFGLAKRLLLRTFDGHADRAVFCFAYCTRHRFFASAGIGHGVVFWNPHTMCVLARGRGHAANVRHCMIDEDSSRVITVSADKAVRCWDSTTFRCIQSFKDTRTHRPDDTITAALWDESKRSLVLAGSALGVWKNQGVIQASTRTHEASVTAALYNKNFHQVVSGDTMGNIQVWFVETGQMAFRFGEAHNVSKICCMCFDASQRRLLTGANDGGVKLWNFSNGKELQLFNLGSSPGAPINEGNGVLGLAYCKDSRGWEEGEEYIVTFSGDQQVRVYAVGNEGGGGPLQPTDTGAGSARIPSRTFSGKRQPRRSARGADGDDGESMAEIAQERPLTVDIFCVAHCGEQQVATGTADGHIVVWATDSGRIKFEMRPSDHDTSNVDDVSSIGGLTSVATRMELARKRGLFFEDGNSADSIGYLDRMGDLLAEDASQTKISWDGREFFAEERMGGSDDGSGTAAAAKDVAAESEEEEGGPGEVEPEAGAGGIKDTNGIETIGEVPGVNSNTTNTPETAGSLKQKKASPDLEGKGKNQQGGNVSKVEASEPSAAQTDVRASRAMGSVTVPGAYESGITSQKVPASGPGSSKGDDGRKAKGETGGVREVGSSDEEARSGSTRKTDATEDKDGGIARLLEHDAAYSVDCLLYMRCHNILISGTASGELHFWDGPTGSFVFGTAAKHPHGGGISAMGSSEGNLSTEIGNGSVAADVAPPTAAATASRTESASLMLYTACDEGFVKTWKVGDLTEHVQTGLRGRPKSGRRNLPGKGKKDNAAVAPPAAADASVLNQENLYHGMQKSLLQPVHLWQAHETTVTSVEGANYRGKLELLVTAGVDCYVHLWTVAGAHVGAFGQPKGPWSLGSRATWLKPGESALLSARDPERHVVEASRAVDSDEQGASSTSTRQDSTLLHRTENRDPGLTTGGGNQHLQHSRKYEVGRRAAKDSDVKAHEELERYQQKRYYAASEARMQRKLLRGQMTAFCMSLDNKESQFQEACQILEATAKKKSAFHLQESSGKPGLGKSRIETILRSTYNQVSFQLHLHQHDDVHEKAEGTLSRRKARRRAKNALAVQHRNNNLSSSNSSSNNNSYNQHHNKSGTAESRPSVHLPPTIPNTLLGTETTEITSPMLGTLTTAGVEIDGEVIAVVGADGDRGRSFESRGPHQPSCSDSGGVGQHCDGARGKGGPAATESEQIVLIPPLGHRRKKDSRGDLRPAAPVQPPSSCATSGRRFRRSSVGR